MNTRNLFLILLSDMRYSEFSRFGVHICKTDNILGIQSAIKNNLTPYYFV